MHQKKDIKRGHFFTAINEVELNVSNYQSLTNKDDYTLNMADFDGTKFIRNGKTVDLTKSSLDEDPILINKVITSGNNKIGYLMYNHFYDNSTLRLNDAFSKLKLQGINELILDLRYNGGGSVETATHLASMIKGQFKNKTFVKERWNKQMADAIEKDSPSIVNKVFVDKFNEVTLNSLNLTKIYIITTSGAASASELIINGLKPYISVIQVGKKTYGKNVGSITVYDSPNYDKENRNPNHKYAMQPLVMKFENSTGFSDYGNGLDPTIKQNEIVTNMGVLGDPSEPMLNTVI
jgi:C-terminal processing protease CtpA/Prc